MYSTLYIGFLLVFLPGRVLSRAGIDPPARFEAPQLAGIAIGVCGAVLALWCIATFGVLGRGTPAPFDPPRRLVVRGPYEIIRNPMYVGAGLALAGAALFYESWALFAYCAGFLLAMHLFVIVYEEPTLRVTFGAEYEGYRERVNRWWPSGGMLRGLALIVTCFPVAATVTLALVPLWSWIEASLGIESLGHSGPAGWCFALIYALCVGSGGLILLRRSRRQARLERIPGA